MNNQDDNIRWDPDPIQYLIMIIFNINTSPQFSGNNIKQEQFAHKDVKHRSNNGEQGVTK